MTQVSDSTLSDIVGRAGVNINADLTMNISMGTMAWGDSDGIKGFNDPNGGMSPWTTVGAGGYVGVTNFAITNLRIKARESDTFNGYHSSAMIKPITIDVATDPTYVLYNGATFVRLGLGSLQISLDHMSYSVQLGGTTALGQELGTVNIGPLAMYINPASYIDIYNSRPGLRCAVYMTVNIIVDELDIDHLSWGDTDGLPGGNPGTPGGVGYWVGTTNTAGYVGIKNIQVGGPIQIAGTVCIDVVSVTANGGVYGGSGLAPFLHQGATSVIHFLFPSVFSVSINGPVTGNVRLDSVSSLDSANTHTLGNIYLQGINFSIRQGSWVDVWAH